MAPEDTAILVSFVMGGRNDRYLGDFTWRLSTCINYLAKNLAALHRLTAAEIVVCDWNSETPLAEVLPLSSAARKVARFICVPPAIAVAAQRDSPFPYVMVQNVGIRRATGKFIVQTDSDILYPQLSLERLFGILSAGSHLGTPLDQALFVASRRQLPIAVAQKRPGLEGIDRYLALYGNMLKLDRLSVGFLAPSAFTLMHRALWDACAGYDERLIYWEWMDIDLYLRVTQRCPWFDLANAGVCLYHLEHYPSEDRLRERKTNPWAAPAGFRNENSSSWGLWDQSFERQTPSETQISEPPTELRALEGKFAPKTAEEIRRELSDPSVLQHLQAAAKMAPSAPAEIPALRALAWYTLNFRPSRYLEFGIRYAHAAAVVALGFPPVEIYGVDSWAPVKARPNVSIYYCAETLTRLDHRGYLRFITGDPNTALQRLCDGFVGKPEFDLVLFRGEMFGDRAFPQAVEVLAHLSLGGLMVVSYESAPQFAEFWRFFRCCPNEADTIELDNRTGLVRIS